MRNWPRTPIQLGGQRYDLCFTLGAVAEAQEVFDARGVEADLLDGLPELTLANVLVLFPCTLRKYHPQLDTGAAKQLVTWEAVFPVAAALRAAWHAAAPNPPTEEKRNKGRSARKSAKDTLTKDQQWERLWSLARYDLRLSTEEFYAMTVGQLDALIRRRERDIQEREFLFGQLASCTVNFSMGRPKDPVQPRDFMPSEWRHQKETQAPRKRRRRQLIATEIRGVMEAFMKGRNSG